MSLIFPMGLLVLKISLKSDGVLNSHSFPFLQHTDRIEQQRGVLETLFLGRFCIDECRKLLMIQAAAPSAYPNHQAIDDSHL
jgi:hypothetical protein